MPDFRVVNHGTVWLIEAVSPEAKSFAEENLQVEPWMGRPDRFMTDHRPARHLVMQLDQEGFMVEGVL